LTKNLPWGHEFPHKISLAVFTFIGHKQTDTQTDKQSIFKDRYYCRLLQLVSAAFEKIELG